MCERYSWIEKENQTIFLTADMVFNTKEGKALQKYSGCTEDYVGHGAIRYYFGNFTGGKQKECTDFSTPTNFPKEIVKAILKGQMVDLGVTVEMLDIFTPKAKTTLLKNAGLFEVWDAYHKARNAYNKASDAYHKAWDAYDKARDAYNKALDVYYEARNACDKAQDACDKAGNAYNKALDVYYEARNANQDRLIAGYKKLLRNKKNLRKVWR